MDKIIFTPIGEVKSEYKGQYSSEEAKKLKSKIIIYSDYQEGLDKIEEFSHLIIIFYCNQLDKKLGKPLKVHLKGRSELPLVGIFASRAQNRPNPIGHTTVKLIEKKGNILIVEGLDAFDKSLIIDLKPYIPSSDRPKNPKIIKF
jgi:tRNA-Thr(GGU) m(6)t(6)A37 methyltransferase TsaA